MKRRRWKETAFRLTAADVVIIDSPGEVWLFIRGTKQPRPLVTKKPRRKA